MGFDGLELVGSAGYLISQFLSGATNHRTDRYGGFLEGRMTFLKEVYTAVRGAVGADFPIVVRLAGNEFVPNGNNNDDCIRIARALEKLGVDGLNITGGWHETAIPQVTMDVPRGAYSYLARRVHDAVSIPVFACNRMDPETGERVLERGDADFIGMCRALIADPELVGKLAGGHPELVRPCIGCNQGCMDNIFKGRRLGCLTNADAGHESDTLGTEARKVLIIGAGVAGMEYAIRAADRGTAVTVWEQAGAAGGQMDIVSAPPGRAGFLELPRYQHETCRALGVEFHFHKRATGEDVLRAVKTEGYDRVVLATGAQPVLPVFSVEPGANVVSAWDVLAGKVGTGKRVVVIGGGAVGLETAVKLAEEGTIDAETLKFLFLNRAETPETLYELLTRGSKSVSVVEMAPKVGADIGSSTKWIVMGELRRRNIRKYTESTVKAIGREGVVAQRGDGSEFTIPADTAVIAVGARSENPLEEQLRAAGLEPIVIGDAKRPRKALDAIRDARDEMKV